MTKAIARDPIYRRRRFQSELIELCVRWYLKTHQPRRPRKVNLDGNAASHNALQSYGKRIPSGGPLWYAVAGISTTSSSSTIERSSAAARRCLPSSPFRTAAVTLAGVQLAHRIRKRQFSFGRGGPRQFSSLKHLWARALTSHDAATNARRVSVASSNRHCTRTQVLAC